MWQSHVEQVVKELNKLHPLPSKGILAGGSLANKLWEKITGNKAVVNDLDVFHFQSIRFIGDVNPYDMSEYFTNITENKVNIEQDYDAYGEILKYNATAKSFYRVLSTERIGRKGILNLVNVEANEENTMVIIDSFDLNCTQVAYNLETKQICFTKAFDQFMQDGMARVVNGNTPSHTLLRLLSKRDALKAKVDFGREITYLASVFRNRINRNVRYNFSKKYLKVYKKYAQEIEGLGYYLEEVDTRFNPLMPKKVWRLTPLEYKPNAHPVNVFDEDPFLDEPLTVVEDATCLPPSLKSSVVTDKLGVEIPHCFNLSILNFYFREIYGNKNLEKLWANVGCFWVELGEDYLEGLTIQDFEMMGTQIELVGKYVTNYPMMRYTLSGMNLQKQLQVVTVLDNYLGKYPHKADLLSVSERILNFTDEEEVDWYFTVQRVHKRKQIAAMQQASAAPENQALPF